MPGDPSAAQGLSARRIALVVAVALFLQMLDGAIIATSLPQMARDFGVEPLELSVGVTTYLLVSAIFIPVAGWMADRFGSTRIFALAVVVFTLSSVACGLAQNVVEFVAARAFQGIGGAFMIPVGRLIAVRNADKSEMLDVMSLITWPALAAPVVGPALGGAITTYFSWRWNFFINVPLGLGMVLVTLALVRDPTPLQRRKLDWLGFLLCGGSLACLLIGLEGVTHASYGLWIMLAVFALGIALGVVSVLHFRRSSNPLIDLVPFRAHTFAISNLLAGNYARIAINAMPFLLPLFFQTAYGLDPLQAGGLTMAYFIGNFSMKSVTSPILRRFGFRPVLVFNGVLAAIFIALCATLAPTTPLPVRHSSAARRRPDAIDAVHLAQQPCLRRYRARTPQLGRDDHQHDRADQHDLRRGAGGAGAQPVHGCPRRGSAGLSGFPGRFPRDGGARAVVRFADVAAGTERRRRDRGKGTCTGLGRSGA